MDTFVRRVVCKINDKFAIFGVKLGFTEIESEFTAVTPYTAYAEEEEMIRICFPTKFNKL